EIEVVLKQHSNIRNCVVLWWEEQSGESGIVGYIVARNQPPPSGGELREFLRVRLPEYMIPGSFVSLNVLPLNANGKVDKRRLSSRRVDEERRLGIAQGSDTAAEAHILPRDMIELQLLHIWEKILPDRAISIMDNFFEIGGHSILAVRLLAHILQQFGRDL